MPAEEPEHITGDGRKVSVVLGERLAVLLDAYAADRNLSRSAAMRELAESGLASLLEGDVSGSEADLDDGEVDSK